MDELKINAVIKVDDESDSSSSGSGSGEKQKVKEGDEDRFSVGSMSIDVAPPNRIEEKPKEIAKDDIESIDVDNVRVISGGSIKSKKDFASEPTVTEKAAAHARRTKKRKLELMRTVKETIMADLSEGERKRRLQT